MTVERSLSRVVRAPAPAPGFIGPGHTAVEVLEPRDLVGNDPFVLLMDDRLDLPARRRVGGPHPHAGIETVTLVLEGAAHDRDEGTLGPGDVLWMSAGRGVVHNEAVEAEPRTRILQLWIRLPAADRDTAPHFELVTAESAPVLRAPGATLRLYSGSSGGTTSPTRNHAPVLMADVQLEAGGSIDQDLPATYNGFFYVLDGTVRAGGRSVAKGEVGWLGRDAAPGFVRFEAPDAPARLILYAGAPQNEPLVHHGPFVAGSAAEIAARFAEFRQGRFEPLSRVAARQRATSAATPLKQDHPFTASKADS
jgi:redox-sensitive bicupin YhaK (pirin superfamily)